MATLLAAVAVATVLVLSGGGASAGLRGTGWTAEERRALGLEDVRKRDCPEEVGSPPGSVSDLMIEREVPYRLRPILDPRWAGFWLNCSGRRAKVGIVPGRAAEIRERVGRVRRKLRQLGVARHTDLVAVRSTVRQLIDGQERMIRPFERLITQGLMAAGRDERRNLIEVAVDDRVSSDDLRAIRRRAKKMPVRVLVVVTDEDLTAQFA